MTVKVMSGGVGMLRKSYVVKSVDYLERHRMSRPSLPPGFSYISFNAIEGLELMAAMKVLHRESAMKAIFDNGRRDRITQLTAANKMLNLLVNKGYAQVVERDFSSGYSYVLDDLGRELLGVSEPPNGDLLLGKTLRFYYSLNRVFVRLCDLYREEGVIEWEVLPVEHIDAVCIVWEEFRGKGPKECMIIKVLESPLPSEQMEEIGKVIEKYAGEEIGGLSRRPDVMVTMHRKEGDMLKVIERGERCAEFGDIERWVYS